MVSFFQNNIKGRSIPVIGPTVKNLVKESVLNTNFKQQQYIAAHLQPAQNAIAIDSFNTKKFLEPRPFKTSSGSGGF